MTVLVYANAEKVYGKEIALGPASAATPERPSSLPCPKTASSSNPWVRAWK